MIAELEHMLEVQLLDRTPRGVEPTVYGSALLRRSIAAFDELRQGIKDIEFLSDPTAGELRIGCPESIAAGYLQPVIARFTKVHPRVVLDVDTVNTQSFSPKLRERLRQHPGPGSRPPRTGPPALWRPTLSAGREGSRSRTRRPCRR